LISRCISASSWLRQYSAKTFTSQDPANLLCLPLRSASSSSCCSLERYLHVGQRPFSPRHQHPADSTEPRFADLGSGRLHRTRERCQLTICGTTGHDLVGPTKHSRASVTARSAGWIESSTHPRHVVVGGAAGRTSLALIKPRPPRGGRDRRAGPLDPQSPRPRETRASRPMLTLRA
jgi:hypothetical protein